jgi:hypothetical protein
MGFGDLLPEAPLPPTISNMQMPLRPTKTNEQVHLTMIQECLDDMGLEKYIDYLVEAYFDKKYGRLYDLSYKYYMDQLVSFMYKPSEKQFYIQGQIDEWYPIKPIRVELLIVLLMDSLKGKV